MWIPEPYGPPKTWKWHHHLIMVVGMLSILGSLLFLVHSIVHG